MRVATVTTSCHSSFLRQHDLGQVQWVCLSPDKNQDTPREYLYYNAKNPRNEVVDGSSGTYTEVNINIDTPKGLPRLN